MENILRAARKEKTWSNYLEKKFGETAALAFQVGSDALWTQLESTLDELAVRPKGTHIGQLNISVLYDLLPRQFLMRYDYEFVYRMITVLNHFREEAETDAVIHPENLLEVLVLYFCGKMAWMNMESEETGLEEDDYLDWVYDLVEDSDLLYLYDWIYLEEVNGLHFNNWLDPFRAGMGQELGL